MRIVQETELLPALRYYQFRNMLNDAANNAEEKIDLHTEERWACPDHGIVRSRSFVCPYC